MLPRLLGVVRPGVKPECICVDTFPGERLRFRSTTLDEVSFFALCQFSRRFMFSNNGSRHIFYRCMTVPQSIV